MSKTLLSILLISYLLLFDSCSSRNHKSDSRLNGQWVEYKVDRLGVEDFSYLLKDSTIKEDEQEQVHRHLEFNPDGTGKEWFIPQEIFDMTFSLNDTTLTINSTKYAVQITEHELILKELDSPTDLDATPNSPYQEIIYFKRIK